MTMQLHQSLVSPDMHYFYPGLDTLGLLRLSESDHLSNALEVSHVFLH